MAKRKALAAPSQPAKAARPADEEPSTSGVDTFKNKERVMVVSSRGITFRQRHFMLDVMQLLPHSKKDAKLDTKGERGVINEVAELKGCSSTIFFEARKHKDLYMWLAKTPGGPTVKFHVANIHTMAELKLSGNHLKGSRPVLSFDAAFDAEPHLQLLKEMLTQTFATPRRHHKVKPFFDHVISFTVADGRIWLRNYQVLPDPDKKRASAESVSLVEVGPRAALNPIKMFAGSFGGPVIFDNPAYVSPNQLRAALRRQSQTKYAHRVDAATARREHVANNPTPQDELAGVFRE